VAEAQEALQGFAFEQLAAGVEIDVQPLAVVHVIHALRHIHLHATQGVSQPLHRLEVEHQIAIHLGGEQLAQLLFHHLRPAAAVEGVGLHHAVAI